MRVLKRKKRQKLCNRISTLNFREKNIFNQRHSRSIGTPRILRNPSVSQVRRQLRAGISSRFPPVSSYIQEHLHRELHTVSEKQVDSGSPEQLGQGRCRVGWGRGPPFCLELAPASSQAPLGFSGMSLPVADVPPFACLNRPRSLVLRMLISTVPLQFQTVWLNFTSCLDVWILF